MYTVIVTEKGGDQRRMDFEKPEITIGRVQGNDIILAKGNVSKRHSRIVLKDGKFIIVDLKSTNGTYVNGRKITSPLVVKDSDKIYIGDFILNVEEGDGVGRGALDSDAMLTGEMNGAKPSPPALPAAPDEVPEPMHHVGSGAHGSHGPPPPPKRATLPPPAPPPPPPRRSAPLAVAPPPREDPDELGELDATGEPEEIRAPVGRATAPRPAVSPPPGLPPAAPKRITGAIPAAPSRPMAAVAEPTVLPPPVTSAPRADAPQRLVGVGAPKPAVPVAAASPGSGPVARSPIAPAKAPSLPTAPAPVDPKRKRELMARLHDSLWSSLDLAHTAKLDDEDLWLRARGQVADELDRLEDDSALPPFLDKEAVTNDVVHEVLGLGPLQVLLADPDVTSVWVNGLDRIVVVRGSERVAVDRAFSSELALKKVIERILLPTGYKVDAQQPLVDARLDNGTHVTVAMPPLAVRGPCLTLRKGRADKHSLEELCTQGMLSAEMAAFLRVCLTAKRSIVVTGGAGAGKTTLLSALAGVLDAGQRIVSVEDVAELSVGREHWIALESRPPGPGWQGGVSLRYALLAALRFWPDRLIVGEVRGVETFELLTAMASAYEGALVGVVAEGRHAALGRLESLARLGAGDASTSGLKALVASAAHIVVEVARFADGTHRVTSISEVTGTSGDGYETEELFHFHAHTGAGRIQGRFVATGTLPRFYKVLEARGLPADASIFR
jgi:pilus assembly protein CpaF